MSAVLVFRPGKVKIEFDPLLPYSAAEGQDHHLNQSTGPSVALIFHFLFLDLCRGITRQELADDAHGLTVGHSCKRNQKSDKLFRIREGGKAIYLEVNIGSLFLPL